MAATWGWSSCFSNGITLYNVHIFATLVMATISHEATEYIQDTTQVNLCLLNDGPFVWITLFSFLFPSHDIWNTIIHQKLSTLTLASCNNDFDKYTEKDQCFFKPVGPHLSLSQTFTFIGTIFTDRLMLILLLGFGNILLPRLSKVTTSFALISLITLKYFSRLPWQVAWPCEAMSCFSPHH